MPVEIHGKQYSTVAERIAIFRDKHQDLTIKTKIINITENRVIVKATILDGDKVLATGHGEELRASSAINRTSALENCETSAVGRALAFYGLGGTEIASANEVEQAIKQQESIGQVNGDLLDHDKLDALVAEAVLIVDECDNDPESGANRARELYEPLSHDERIYFNGKVQEHKFKNPITGRECGYWQPFKKHLIQSAETT